MRFLVLSSVQPDFNHSVRAGHKVMAHLMEYLALAGHQVSFATAQALDAQTLNGETRKVLEKLGVKYLGDFSEQLAVPGKLNKFMKFAQAIRTAFAPAGMNDPVRFKDAEKIAGFLRESRADIALLFWDTWFEYLLPDIGMPTIAYWAKPRFASQVARIESGLGSLKFWEKPKSRVALRILSREKALHIQKARMVSRLSNICAVDAGFYEQMGIRCRYISNFWPDAFGSSWREQRINALKENKLEILASIGGLYGTGNYFGLKYLLDEILPKLAGQLQGIDWHINICGSGALPDDLAPLLKHPRVTLKGYVPDIDGEVMANQIFLLLNNAGPYSGGYTRVVYAFSSGACLVSHKKLADSMPEVRHGVNALLGETAEEITGLIARVAKDETLRNTIGANARRTYEEEYHPKVAVSKIIDLAQEALEKRGH